MDLVYLETRYRDSIACAVRAACIPARRAHEGLARLYAARINEEKLRHYGHAFCAAQEAA